MSDSDDINKTIIGKGINDTIRGGALSNLGTIDRYELIQELGGGAFGVVFLAYDTVERKNYAVKGLPSPIKRSTEELEEIRDNFRLFSSLHHPHIANAKELHVAQMVRYVDENVEKKLCVFPRDYLIVMEYAPGVTLSSWRRKFAGKKVPLEQTLKIVRQIAEALDYAHSRHNIIHRDIKPSNIMIEICDDASLIARVLDFGLAAQVRTSLSHVSKDVTSQSGTYSYMAPEQWAGKKQGFATDQYALAVMTYELLTGEVPFSSVFDTGDRILMQNIVINAPVEIDSSLPPVMQQVFKKALAKEGKNRYQTCGDFVVALAGKFSVNKTPVVGNDVKDVKDVKDEKKEKEISSTSLVKCPICGRTRNITDTFTCVKCGKENLCWDGHYNKEYNCCEDCANDIKAKKQQEEARRRKEEEEKKRREQTLYRVIDLRTGTIDYLNEVPSGGWSDEYKTRKLVLRRIEAGSFTMGDSDKKPVHKVTLTQPFYIGVFQVTQAQWEKVMGNNPSHFKGDTLPVEQVSYDDIRGKGEGARWPKSAGVDADSFMGKLRALTKRDGKVQGFDLPTEAQWEYACRAGTTGDYSGTGKLDEMGWYGERKEKFVREEGFLFKKKVFATEIVNSGGVTHPVGQKRANAWGVYDMHGNVWEWCLDWHGDYRGDNVTDPKGAASGSRRVDRGGSWDNFACRCRSAYRRCNGPGRRDVLLGVRLVCAAGPHDY